MAKTQRDGTCQSAVSAVLQPGTCVSRMLTSLALRQPGRGAGLRAYTIMSARCRPPSPTIVCMHPAVGSCCSHRRSAHLPGWLVVGVRVFGVGSQHTNTSQLDSKTCACRHRWMLSAPLVAMGTLQTLQQPLNVDTRLPTLPPQSCLSFQRLCNWHPSAVHAAAERTKAQPLPLPTDSSVACLPGPPLPLTLIPAPCQARYYRTP